MDFEIFSKEYDLQHPSSIPVKPEDRFISPYPKWTGKAVFVMFVGAAILSGVHTIPVAYAGIPKEVPDVFKLIAAIASFTAVEFAILLSAFMMLVKNSMRLARIVLVMSAGIAIVANVLSIGDAMTTNAAFDLGVAAVSIAFGVGAPMIALAAGKQFVNIHNAERKALNELQDIYRDECQAYDKKKLAAFRKVEKDMSKEGVQKVSNGQSQSVSRKEPDEDKFALVYAYFEANPEEISRGLRPLADQLDVSKGTVANARKAYQEAMNGRSTNGHH